MASKTFLVLCATGNQGGAVVKTLSALAASNNANIKILAASRNPASQKANELAKIPGVTLVQASAEEPQTLIDALQTHGPVDGAFLVSPPLVPGEEEDCIRAAKLFKDHGTKHLVYSGVDLCGKPSLPLVNFEKKRPVIEYIRALDSPQFRTTLIGPVTFMDNFVNVKQFFLPSVLGVWRAGHKRQFVWSHDIGRAAAICLIDGDKYGGMEFTLSGDSLTPEEIAAAFQEVKGIKLPTDEKPNPPPFLKTNFEWFNENSFSADVEQSREMFPGMTDFRTYLATQYK